MAKRRVSEASRMAEAGYAVPAALAAVMTAESAPEAYLARGKKHKHEWRAHPSDETLDSCRWCGQARRVKARQPDLFSLAPGEA